MRGVMIDLGTYYWTGLGSTRFAVAVTNFGNDLAPDGEVVLVGNRTKSRLAILFASNNVQNWFCL